MEPVVEVPTMASRMTIGSARRDNKENAPPNPKALKSRSHRTTGLKLKSPTRFNKPPKSKTSTPMNKKLGQDGKPMFLSPSSLMTPKRTIQGLRMSTDSPLSTPLPEKVSRIVNEMKEVLSTRQTNWQKRKACLQTLQSLANPENCNLTADEWEERILPVLSPALSVQLSEIRSNLVIEACRTVSAIVERVKTLSDQLMCDLLEPLCNLTGQATKCMQTAGDRCLSSVMKHALPRTFIKLLQRAEGELSPLVSAACVKHISLAVKTWPTDELEPFILDLQPAIIKHLGGAAVEVRKYARELYFNFKKRYPILGSAVYERLSQPMRRQMEREGGASIPRKKNGLRAFLKKKRSSRSLSRGKKKRPAEKKAPVSELVSPTQVDKKKHINDTKNLDKQIASMKAMESSTASPVVRKVHAKSLLTRFAKATPDQKKPPTAHTKSTPSPKTALKKMMNLTMSPSLDEVSKRLAANASKLNTSDSAVSVASPFVKPKPRPVSSIRPNIPASPGPRRSNKVRTRIKTPFKAVVPPPTETKAEAPPTPGTPEAKKPTGNPPSTPVIPSESVFLNPPATPVVDKKVGGVPLASVVTDAHRKNESIGTEMERLILKLETQADFSIPSVPAQTVPGTPVIPSSSTFVHGTPMCTPVRSMGALNETLDGLPLAVPMGGENDTIGQAVAEMVELMNNLSTSSPEKKAAEDFETTAPTRDVKAVCQTSSLTLPAQAPRDEVFGTPNRMEESDMSAGEAYQEEGLRSAEGKLEETKWGEGDFFQKMNITILNTPGKPAPAIPSHRATPAAPTHSPAPAPTPSTFRTTIVRALGILALIPLFLFFFSSTIQPMDVELATEDRAIIRHQWEDMTIPAFDYGRDLKGTTPVLPPISTLLVPSIPISEQESCSLLDAWTMCFDGEAYPEPIQDLNIQVEVEAISVIEEHPIIQETVEQPADSIPDAPPPSSNQRWIVEPSTIESPPAALANEPEALPEEVPEAVLEPIPQPAPLDQSESLPWTPPASANQRWEVHESHEAVVDIPVEREQAIVEPVEATVESEADIREDAVIEPEEPQSVFGPGVGPDDAEMVTVVIGGSQEQPQIESMHNSRIVSEPQQSTDSEPKPNSAPESSLFNEVREQLLSTGFSLEIGVLVLSVTCFGVALFFIHAIQWIMAPRAVFSTEHASMASAIDQSPSSSPPLVRNLFGSGSKSDFNTPTRRSARLTKSLTRQGTPYGLKRLGSE